MTKLNNRQIAAFLEFGKGAVEEIIAEELLKGNHSYEFNGPCWGGDTLVIFDEDGIIDMYRNYSK